MQVLRSRISVRPRSTISHLDLSRGSSPACRYEGNFQQPLKLSVPSERSPLITTGNCHYRTRTTPFVELVGCTMQYPCLQPWPPFGPKSTTSIHTLRSKPPFPHPPSPFPLPFSSILSVQLLSVPLYSRIRSRDLANSPNYSTSIRTIEIADWPTSEVAPVSPSYICIPPSLCTILDFLFAEAGHYFNPPTVHLPLPLPPSLISSSVYCNSLSDEIPTRSLLSAFSRFLWVSLSSTASNHLNPGPHPTMVVLQSGTHTHS